MVPPALVSVKCSHKSKSKLFCWKQVLFINLHSPMKMKKTAKEAMSQSDWKNSLDMSLETTSLNWFSKSSWMFLSSMFPAWFQKHKQTTSCGFIFCVHQSAEFQKRTRCVEFKLKFCRKNYGKCMCSGKRCFIVFKVHDQEK